MHAQTVETRPFSPPLLGPGNEARVCVLIGNTVMWRMHLQLLCVIFDSNVPSGKWLWGNFHLFVIDIMYLLFLVALGVQAPSAIPENTGVLVAGRTYRVCQQG